jgi:large subunit ribosomal protein L13
MIIDADGAVVGRLASFVAKKLLEGENIEIINAEKAIITGDPKIIVEKYLEKINRGSPHHGPFYPRQPHRILRRVIRGMLPYKTAKGRNALKRLKVYIGVPEDLKGKEAKTMKEEKRCKYITLLELSKRIGGWKD